MENKLEKIGQNNFMDNFVKTDDILKDMCGIIESSQKAAYRAVNTKTILLTLNELKRNKIRAFDQNEFLHDGNRFRGYADLSST